MVLGTGCGCRCPIGGGRQVVGLCRQGLFVLRELLCDPQGSVWPHGAEDTQLQATRNRLCCLG